MYVAFSLMQFVEVNGLVNRLKRFVTGKPIPSDSFGGCSWSVEHLVLDCMRGGKSENTREYARYLGACAELCANVLGNKTRFTEYLKCAAYCLEAPNRSLSHSTVDRAVSSVMKFVDMCAFDGAELTYEPSGAASNTLLPFGECLIALLHFQCGSYSTAQRLVAEALDVAWEWQAESAVAQAAWLDGLLTSINGTSSLGEFALRRAGRVGAMYRHQKTSLSAAARGLWSSSFEAANCALQLAIVHAGIAAVTRGRGSTAACSDGDESFRPVSAAARLSSVERARHFLMVAETASQLLPEPQKSIIKERTGYMEATLFAAWGMAPLTTHVSNPLQHAVFLAASGRNREALRVLDAGRASISRHMSKEFGAVAAAVSLNCAMQQCDYKRARELVREAHMKPSQIAFWLPELLGGSPSTVARGISSSGILDRGDRHDIFERVSALQTLIAIEHECTGRAILATRALTLCNAFSLDATALSCIVTLAECVLRSNCNASSSAIPEDTAGATNVGAARLALSLLDIVFTSTCEVPVPVEASAHSACARCYLLSANSVKLPAVRKALLQRAAAEMIAARDLFRSIDDLRGVASSCHVIALISNTLNWPKRRNEAAAEWLRCQRLLNGRV